MKGYAPIEISGNDFETVRDFQHRITFSPNRIHSLFLTSDGNGIFRIMNGSNVSYQFSISRDGRVMATIDYKNSVMLINNQWVIENKLVRNNALATSPNIRRSRNLNFEIGNHGIGRMDVRFENMEYVTLFFNDRELYSVTFAGDNDQGMTQFIDQECAR